jgi:hypothetical protein
MENNSKLVDMLLAHRVGQSDNESWAHREREIYTGEAMEKELEELFPVHRLIEGEEEGKPLNC